MERITRYRDKIDYIVDSLELIREPKNELELSGIFYRLHTSIEAAMDLTAMMVKDIGRKVEDDYLNIATLENSGIISRELAEQLRKCNGLRNYLVHRYNKVDEQIALDSIALVKKTLYEFIEVIEGFLNELYSAEN